MSLQIMQLVLRGDSSLPNATTPETSASNHIGLSGCMRSSSKAPMTLMLLTSDLKLLKVIFVRGRTSPFSKLELNARRQTAFEN